MREQNDRAGTVAQVPKVSPARMTAWYDPLQLLRTGVNVALSAAFSGRADFRLVEALTSPQKEFRYGDFEELWIDFVADVGDGWNSTYSVAAALASPTLTIDGHETRRGQILVMGGDEVYPIASRDAYDKKLVAPYQAALPMADGAPPHLFAIPGNHDWYDGLSSFMRLFGQRDALGGWQTQQTRSYFALELPHNWWLLGVDIQLASDIDWPQLEYFRGVAGRMSSESRVIICTAEPDWIYGNIYDPKLQRNLARLESEVIRASGAEVCLRLAGDLHHYRRHTSQGGVHNVTAGGGGAFLHPTHGPSVQEVRSGPSGDRDTYSLQASYPTEECSRRLAWRNLAFPLINPTFGIVTALAYVGLASAMPRPDGKLPLEMAVLAACKSTLLAPSALLWVLVVLGAFVLFTDTHSKPYKWVAGIVHGAAHLSLALVLAWTAEVLALHVGHLSGEFQRRLGAVVMVAFGGYIAGPLLMGIYLLVSLNVFGRHGNEAFSSLRIADYKNFVRMHLGRDGSVTLYPIAIDRSARKWKVNAQTGAAPQMVPLTAQTSPTLIEPPIRMGGS